MNDALVDHAVDHRRRIGKRSRSFRLLAGFEREGRLTDGTAQLRSERVITGAVRRRLAGSFFGRFRIRQAGDSLKSEPRSLPIGLALVN